MTCKHQFIELREIIQNRGMRTIHGKMVMCANCGETRKLWENGELDIIQNDDSTRKTKN